MPPVQLFLQPSAPRPGHRAQALWTAFGIFMPFIIDPGLAGAEDSNCEILSEAGGQFFKPSNPKFEWTETTRLFARVFLRVDMYGSTCSDINIHGVVNAGPTRRRLLKCDGGVIEYYRMSLK